jgi:hypothetical protein
VNPRVEFLLRRLAGKRGWFVPVSALLDFLRQQRQTGSISRSEMARMEHQWLFDRVFSVTTRAMHKLRSHSGPVSQNRRYDQASSVQE